MLKNKSEKAFVSLRHRGFDGIRKDAVTVGKGASEIRNFRVLSDGSLEKRCGFLTLRTFSNAIRGFWHGTLGAMEFFFVVVGNEVCSIDAEGQESTVLLNLDTYSGKVQFCTFDNNLLLLDGTKIYYWFFTPDAYGWRELHPYAPLIGENWDAISGGPSLEPYNLITPKKRIRYLFQEDDLSFCFPFIAVSVDAVLIDGIPTTDYTFTRNSSHFNLLDSRAVPGSIIEVLVSSGPYGIYPSAITSCTNGFFFRSANRSTMFLSNGSEPCNVYYTCPVPDERIKECNDLGYLADPFYVKKGQVFTVGDPLHPVTGFCRNHDQLLAFTEKDTWSIRFSEDGSDVSAYPLLSGVGCVSHHSVLNVGKDIYILSANGFNRLSSSNQDPDLISVTPLSRDVPALSATNPLSDSFCCLHLPQNEIWIRNPNDADGLVWIWNLDNQKWYCFDGIFADTFFDTSYGLYFANDKKWNRIEELLNTDNGSDISASYSGDYLDFGIPETVKRTLCISLTAHIGNDYVRMSLDNGTVFDSFRVHGKVSQSPETVERRIHLGRFRNVRYQISSTGSTRSRFYEVLLSANL